MISRELGCGTDKGKGDLNLLILRRNGKQIAFIVREHGRAITPLPLPSISPQHKLPLFTFLPPSPTFPHLLHRVSLSPIFVVVCCVSLWHYDTPELPNFMKIEKYIFCLPKAVRLSCQRMGIRTLRPSELFLLYASTHLIFPSGQNYIRFAKRYGHKVSHVTAYEGIDSLKYLGLLDEKNNITDKGRDLLSGIRRYLVNIRL